MGGTVSDSKKLAFGIAETAALHNGGNVVVLDMAEASGWTDWFVIATATSVAHLRGLARFVDEYCAISGDKPRGRPDSGDEQPWLLLDLGDVIVHLMTVDAREFYDLEKLWFKAGRTEVLAPSGPHPAAPTRES